MLISPASSPNSHWREDGDLGDRFAVCSVETKEGNGERDESAQVRGSGAHGRQNDARICLRVITVSFLKRAAAL